MSNALAYCLGSAPVSGAVSSVSLGTPVSLLAITATCAPLRPFAPVFQYTAKLFKLIQRKILSLSQFNPAKHFLFQNQLFPGNI
jgi:hypothetical protein